MQNNRTVGAGYERLAADTLRGKGYGIMAQNYRCHLGEIDLIAVKGGVLVFVEVKYRADGTLGDPLEAVGPLKQRRIYRVAQVFMKERHIPQDTPCRFDVIGICGREIAHVENAFGGM